MKFQILIIKIIFAFLYPVVKRLKINQKAVAFISLESVELEGDQKLIYDALKNRGYDLRIVSMKFDKKTLWTSFLYFVNMIKQLYVINTSKVVLINYNNYVVSNYKRDGIIIIQLWHAAGAVKKFGSALERQYEIKNYDYVLCNSEYWKEPYSEAFNVKKEQVIVTGMPNLDELCDKEKLQAMQDKMVKKYPQLLNKKVVLYAPTFRGNIYTKFTKVDIDLVKLSELLGEQYYIIYKLHPLMITQDFKENDHMINGNYEDLHELFAISDCLISDYSSIIFEYCLLNKDIYYYVPDYEEYGKNIGYYIDFEKDMNKAMCINEQQLSQKILQSIDSNHELLKNKYMKYQDGNNLARTIKFIEKIM